MADTAARRNRPYAPRMTPEQRREQLLDTVLDIINTDGVAAVSMDAVAKRAGVTRPVVYGVFRDTDDILNASLDREEERAIAQFSAAVQAPGRSELSAALASLCEAFLGAVTDAPQRWRAIYQVADSGTPAFHRRVDLARSGIVQRLTQTLSESEAFGDDHDHELLAHHLVAAIWDAGRLLLTSPREFPRRRLLRSLGNLVDAVIPRRG